MSVLRPLAGPARAAARALATTPSEVKAVALGAMAGALGERADEILAANREDVARAQVEAATGAVVDRLTLDRDRLLQVAAGVRQIAALPDPIGHVIEERTLPNGLHVRKVRVPLGVVGVIYEGRPNVTVDAAALAVRSGNAVLLRGSRIAERSNAALVEALRDAGEGAGLPPAAIQGVRPTRESAREMMRARDLLDLLIPRGGNDLIQAVVSESQVPVIETGVGNCHVYVDRAADLEKALRIVVNAKVQRPGVCNAAESFLIHRDLADTFLPKAVTALQEHGVTVYGDEAVRASGQGIEPAGDEEYRAEFLDLRIAGRVVGSLDEALDHIARFGTRHTEAIVTEDPAAARRFVDEVDAAAVMVNASTRFTDGFEFGMGAEIGISTQKLHARGPMALPELTSYKWVVEGDGQIRS
ncbi:MAG TPA: glutamate-5-semialdehyde dehydrogenase [Actinomycetota bacterium]|nr:glutamate-5-semialdehyde dehydrogenase [Actinomycetota bacterium]